MKERRSTIYLNSAAKISLGVMFLVLGGLIYLLFRSKSLYIYIWCESLGLADLIDTLRFYVLDWVVPDYIKFSLPDGLYCAAYLLIIEAIWHEDKSWKKNLILSVVPIVVVCSEIMQYFGIVRGTFDIIDLFCYLFPPLLYFVMCTQKQLYLSKVKRVMNKIFPTTFVIVLFAICFVASDEDEKTKGQSLSVMDSTEMVGKEFPASETEIELTSKFLPKEKEIADAGYEAGSIMGLAGGCIEGFSDMIKLANYMNAMDNKSGEMIREIARNQYDREYQAPANVQEEKLKEIYVDNFVRGMNKAIRATNH